MSRDPLQSISNKKNYFRLNRNDYFENVFEFRGVVFKKNEKKCVGLAVKAHTDPL